MDHFTKEFCKKAFVRFPEWESVAVPVNYTNSDAYYLSFDFQSPGPSGEKMEGERGEKCTYLEVETFMESDKEAFKSVRSWKGTYDLG